MFCSTVFVTILTLLGSSLVYERLLKRKNSQKENQRYPAGTHVIISGGSKGIGKSLAKRFAELGTHVTIIARNENDLREAKNEIEKSRKLADVQQIRTVSLDLTKLTFPDNLLKDKTDEEKEILEQLLGEHERCDILINCCGSAVTGRFDELSKQQFQYMMNVNYFSAVNLTRLLLPVMKARSLVYQNGSRTSTSFSNERGRIVFVSSMCGLMSFFGYSAYAASKFALVGLAESLSMELKPFDIGVTVAFPPDTDTPGFEEENKTKPELTTKISESGSVYSPDQVAKALVSDVRAKNFQSTVGLENICVLTALNTFMPSTSVARVIIESFLVGPLRIVGYFILRSWYKLVDEAAPNEIVKAEMELKCLKNSNGRFCDDISK